MEPIRIKPAFIQTQNVRGFTAIMDGLDLAKDEGRLGLVYGQAGRGKTRTAQWYSAHNGCVYLRVLTIWRTSETAFLKSICRELGSPSPPYHKDHCFQEIVDLLIEDRRMIFLDEIEKMPPYFLDLIRDFADVTGTAWVLIGENELLPYIRQNRRVWSRTFQQIEFQPISEGDIILYGREAGSIGLPSSVAKVLLDASGGDFRLVRRDFLTLVHYANSVPTRDITEDMARIAVKVGLKGKGDNGKPPLKAV